ncbi:hypothetical protein ACFOW6_13675 [Fodinicurvata halophila]|uniref:Uncharacterized protein n=1 Tax=Fodinicurvata halophila TaxID=1419723 RepID=A0ABV8UMV9_9PROT
MRTPLTREAVTRVLGPVDNTISAELVATGASEAELQEAHAWLNNDEALINEGRHFPTGRVAELLEILKLHEEETPEVEQ